MENRNTEIKIREPRNTDIRGIVEVIRDCEPFLTAHSSYIVWMYVEFFAATCAVAERAGEIVGWCSMVPAPGGRHLLHQLGVAPHARRQGIATSLFAHTLQKLDLQRDGFALEFTVDRRNGAVPTLNRKIADFAGMQIVKRAETLHLVEESEEELLHDGSAKDGADDQCPSRPGIRSLAGLQIGGGFKCISRRIYE